MREVMKLDEPALRAVRQLIAGFAVITLISCSPRLTIKSDPVQADVFVVRRQSGERQPLGQTPLEIPTAKVNELAGTRPSAGGFHEVIVEKPGYKSEKFMLPATGFGSLGLILDVKLTPGQPVEKVADEVLQTLMNAQRFATQKEYERAKMEIDRLLTVHPKLTRAIALRGAIFFVQKKYAESREAYEEVLKQDPQSQSAIDMLARIKAAEEGRSTSNRRRR